MSAVTPLPPIPTPAIVPPIQTTQLILNTPSLTIPSPRVGPTLIPTSQTTQDPLSPSNPVPTPRVGSTLIPVFQSETIKRQITLTTNNSPIIPRNKLIVVFPSITPPPVSRPKLRQVKRYPITIRPVRHTYSTRSRHPQTTNDLPYIPLLHSCNAVIDPATGYSLEYHHLVDKSLYTNSFAD